MAQCTAGTQNRGGETQFSFKFINLEAYEGWVGGDAKKCPNALFTQAHMLVSLWCA